MVIWKYNRYKEGIMRKKIISVALSFCLMLASMVLLSACGSKDLDLNKIKVGESVFMYDGNSHIYEVTYEDLNINVTYAESKESEFKPASELSYINRGHYNVYYKISAEGYNDYVSPEAITIKIMDAVEVVGANTSTYYSTFAEALAANTNGASMVLHKDMILTSGVSIDNGKEYKINLNGHNIAGPTVEEIYLFRANGVNSKLIIEGEGVVNSASSKNDYSMAVWARNGGTIEINGGSFTNVGARAYEVDKTTGQPITTKPNNNELIYASTTTTNASSVIINGGTFVGNYENAKWGVRYTVNKLDGDISAISVKGGQFRQYDPANSLSENPAGAFVATGYTSVKTTINGVDWYVVMPSTNA